MPQPYPARTLHSAYIFLTDALSFVATKTSERADRYWGTPLLRYFFEDYSFDTDHRELRRGPDVIPTTPQVFDLLYYLISNRDRVVSKNDLVKSIWNGRVVSDSAVTTRLNAVRSAIGDCGEQQRLIKTLPRKGFRFVGSLEETSGPRAGSQVQLQHSGETAPTRASPPHLSIVVLPFSNMSGDPEQDYFVNGVTESLTTDLSRISGAFVIARNTAFTFKDKAADVREVGRELNVRYVLEGSIQRGGNRLRVNVQLIDAETAKHLWAERFDKAVGDLFDMQDEIVSALANVLDAELVAAEARRGASVPNPTSMDLYFQGQNWWNKGFTPECMSRSNEFFERALALDPGNVPALYGTAVVDVVVATNFLTADSQARFATAEQTLAKVLAFAPKYGPAHGTLGAVLMCTRRGVQAIQECETALAFDRNLSKAHALIGLAKYLLGRGKETEGHVEMAFRLSPRDPMAYQWMHYLGLAKAQLTLFDEAVVRFRRSLQANRNNALTYFHLAASLVRLGKLDEARDAVRTGLALNPSFTARAIRDSNWSNAPAFVAGRERLVEGMLKAGVPEG